MLGADERRRDAAVERDVGDEPDEAGQHVREQRRADADEHRDAADDDDALIDRRVLGGRVDRRERRRERRCDGQTARGVERSLCDSSATRHASGGGLVLEHHWCSGQVDAAREHPRLQQFGELRTLLGLHARHTVHQIALHRWRRATEHGLPSGVRAI